MYNHVFFSKKEILPFAILLTLFCAVDLQAEDLAEDLVKDESQTEYYVGGAVQTEHYFEDGQKKKELHYYESGVVEEEILFEEEYELSRRFDEQGRMISEHFQYKDGRVASNQYIDGRWEEETTDE